MPLPAAVGAPSKSRQEDRRGRAFLALSDLSRFARTEGGAAGETVLTSPELPVEIPANEVVVSWNADAPEGTGLKIEARTLYADRATKFYTLGLWSKDGKSHPRESVEGQKDSDGNVLTDTLVLKQPPQALQLRVTLKASVAGTLPTLKFVGVSLADTKTLIEPMEPKREVWGRELIVPERQQSGWPGASGWCSPTSTAMVLAYWGQKASRSELDLTVPEAARACYDRIYDGTGNWPFNTAFAGAFPGIRAYVTRLADIRQLEEWIAAGIPPIVSVSYDLLKGKPKAADAGHLMVCNGFTQEGDIVLNDPATRLDKGEKCRKVFPRAHFLRAWKNSKNTVYLIYPEGAKIPDNSYRHWADQ